MKVCRSDHIHFRFEPGVDDGTSYAFNYRKDRLVIGRENMYRLCDAVTDRGVAVHDLAEQLVDAACSGEQKYRSEVDLLVDLTRLVDAQVLKTQAH